MSTVGGLVAFVVSLLVGALGIYVGARIVVGRTRYGRAVVTALFGALVWGFAAAFLTGVPLVGSILPLLAWVAVIKWRYPVGWLEAAVVGIVAWLVAAVVIEVLPVDGLEAVGVPFV
ncbi:MAG: hypothetical protein ABEJ74_00545 [Haloferacaceae archaeon]